MKLTLEQRAAKYPTRSQLSKHDPTAYIAAQKKGLLNTLYPNPGTTPAPLTEQIIIARAKECSTRNEFKFKHDTAWRHARKLGLMDRLFPPKPKKVRPTPKPKKEEWEKLPAKPRVLRKLSHDLARSIASQHQTRSSLDAADPSIMAYLRKHDLVDEVFPGPIQTCAQTTEGFIAKAKGRHGDKFDYSEVEYRRGNEKVKIICKTHGAFWQRPWAHLEGSGCAKCWSFDNDAFYMKKAEGCYFNGEQIYKVGVTSIRLGDARLRQQERNAKIKHSKVIAPTEVVGSATDIESFALSLGHNPGLTGFDGCTEYRAYSAEDVRAIKDMVELCAGKNPGVKARSKSHPNRMTTAKREVLKAEVQGLFKKGDVTRKELAARYGLKYGRISSWLVGLEGKRDLGYYEASTNRSPDHDEHTPSARVQV